MQADTIWVLFMTDKQKWQRLLSSLRYSLYVIFHPFDGFWDLSREKRGSLGAANIIVFLVLLVRLLSMQFTPFLFMKRGLLRPSSRRSKPQ